MDHHSRAKRDLLPWHSAHTVRSRLLEISSINEKRSMELNTCDDETRSTCDKPALTSSGSTKRSNTHEPGRLRKSVDQTMMTYSRNNARTKSPSFSVYRYFGHPGLRRALVTTCLLVPVSGLIMVSCNCFSSTPKRRRIAELSLVSFLVSQHVSRNFWLLSRPKMSTPILKETGPGI